MIVAECQRERSACLELELGKPPTAPSSGCNCWARDLIVATRAPQELSVRNNLTGVVTAVTDDHEDSDLIAIDIGGTIIMARVTKAATRELGLVAGLSVWALVKTVSLRPHPI